MTNGKNNITVIEEISRKLEDRRLSVVAKRCGLSYITMLRLSDYTKGKETRNFSSRTLGIVLRYLEHD